MNTDNNRNDVEEDADEVSRLNQDERTDRKLFGEFGFAALAGLGAFLSALLTTVVEGQSGWRPFWLVVCIICLVCAIGLIVQGTRHFGDRP
jgi:MFS family permease